MSKKYLPADSPSIITNDIFLASFLHCVGCTLARVEKNDRRRVSFVFVGERVRELREAYRTGKVSLDLYNSRTREFFAEACVKYLKAQQSAVMAELSQLIAALEGERIRSVMLNSRARMLVCLWAKCRQSL